MNAVTYTCKQCGTPFVRVPHPAHEDISYCSRKCQVDARRSPLGTESICVVFGHNGKRKHQEWFVKVNHHGHPRVKFKRKATLVAERMLGRKIIKGERIVFLDGNTLNCAPTNIIVPGPTCKVEMCGRCRSPRIIRPGTKTPYCAQCTRKPQKKRKVRNQNKELYRSKLNINDVADIRLLLHFGISSVLVGRLCQVSTTSIRKIALGVRWKGIAMAAKPGWMVLLERIDKLIQRAGSCLYDRIRLLAKVFDDREFQKFCSTKGQTPAEFLESRVSDTCANFTELYQMIKMFPHKMNWTKGSLANMRLKLLESIRHKQRKDKKPTTRTIITRAQYDELLQENKILKQRVEHLEAELRTERELTAVLKGRQPVRTAPQHPKHPRRRQTAH